jgi:formylglycine-generating enzyme required for sulfatase activity
MKYYEILDVPPDATAEQIRTAYRILVQLHHPDRLQQVSESVRQYAEDRLKKINEAYAVLGDGEKRARYDATRVASHASGFGSYRDTEAEYGASADDGWSATKPRGRRRPMSEETAAARAAYEEWAHKEAERYAEARAAERARQAARENREAEQRARQAAEEQFPRVRRIGAGDELVVNLAGGVWTTLSRVAGGDFLMGSQPAQDPDAGRAEQPQHRVLVSDFYISRFPVTNAQFQAFTRAAKYALPLGLPRDRDAHPVVNVTWDDAAAFCRWLSTSTGRTFRLPTEAEWEKAARGTDGRLYPWGNLWDPARLNCQPAPAATVGTTTPVGRYSPAGDSPYGAADMSGNVWEWCSDWFDGQMYARRAARPARDPQGPSTGPGYVARGGAFNSSAKQVRTAHRNWYYPDDRRPDLGFRFVVEPF